jgi:membrane protease YdiL (CAAX protease family)
MVNSSMKNIQRLKAIWFILLCIVIFMLAKLLFTAVFGFFEPAVPGIEFEIIERNPVWKTSWLFAALLAFIPLALLALWRGVPIVSTSRRLLSVIIILLMMVAAIYIRHTEVRTYFNRVVVPFFQKKGQAHVVYPIDPVNFVYYMFIGLFAGLVICWLVFRNHRRRNTLIVRSG